MLLRVLHDVRAARNVNRCNYIVDVRSRHLHSSQFSYVQIIRSCNTYSRYVTRFYLYTCNVHMNCDVSFLYVCLRNIGDLL